MERKEYHLMTANEQQQYLTEMIETGQIPCVVVTEELAKEWGLDSVIEITSYEDLLK